MMLSRAARLVLVALLLALFFTPAQAAYPDAAVAILDATIEAIEAAGLPPGVARSFVRKLRAAQASIERGHLRAAFGQLGAFEAEARAKRGKVLTDEQADGALAIAAEVKIALDPGPPPVLKNLVVDFDGDFVFAAAESKVFLEFGAVVIGPEGPKTLPTFEYRVVPDAVAMSPIDGTVKAIFFQSDTNDYEIHLVGSPTSPFIVGVDHVTALTVAEGDVVTAGQTLGTVGPWSPTLGRTELQIFNFIEKQNYCPWELFDPALAPTFQSKVSDFMADWETFKADTSLYDEAAMTAGPGCLSATLPES